MHLLLSVLFSLGIVIVAILSVQNATAISLQFLVWSSVTIPVGIVLALAMGVGVLVGAIAAPLLPQKQIAARRRRYPDFEDSGFTDDDPDYP